MLGMSALNRKPRQYSYKPVFHDPEQEVRDQRRAESMQEKDDNYVPGKYIKSQRSMRIMGLDAPKMVRPDRLRILVRVVIFIFIAIVAYLIVSSDVITKLIMINS